MSLGIFNPFQGKSLVSLQGTMQQSDLLLQDLANPSTLVTSTSILIPMPSAAAALPSIRLSGLCINPLRLGLPKRLASLSKIIDQYVDEMGGDRVIHR